MKLNKTSLAIGVGVGVVVSFAIAAAAFALRPVETLPADSATDGSFFFITGLIREISATEMIVDQSFSNGPGEGIEYEGIYRDPTVKIRFDRGGAVFLNCYEDGESRQAAAECAETLSDEELSKGISICAIAHFHQ